MTEYYEVGDIIRNTYYNINMLILEKSGKAGSYGADSTTCFTLLLSKGKEKHHYIGAKIRWAGWPNNGGPWEKLA
jgi:hypothetical protein